MTKGKRLECPKIVVTYSKEPRFASREEAWQVVGPILARILAQTLAYEKKKQEQAEVQLSKKGRKKDHGDH